MSLSINTAEQLEAFFRKLQIEQKGVLGDITLTVGQQDELVEAFRDKDESVGDVRRKLRDMKDTLDEMVEP